jgi:hypothetical protein
MRKGYDGDYLLPVSTTMVTTRATTTAYTMTSQFLEDYFLLLFPVL